MHKSGIAGLVGAAIFAAMAGVANADISERTIRVGSTLTPEHPNGIAVEAMAKCAADRTGGKMTIQGIYNAALGGDQEMSQAARAGTVRPRRPGGTGLDPPAAPVYPTRAVTLWHPRVAPHRRAPRTTPRTTATAPAPASTQGPATRIGSSH